MCDNAQYSFPPLNFHHYTQLFYSFLLILHNCSYLFLKTDISILNCIKFSCWKRDNTTLEVSWDGGGGRIYCSSTASKFSIFTRIFFSLTVYVVLSSLLHNSIIHLYDGFWNLLFLILEKNLISYFGSRWIDFAVTFIKLCILSWSTLYSAQMFIHVWVNMWNQDDISEIDYSKKVRRAYFLSRAYFLR